MAAIITKKLPAASILETLVAMIIILVVFGIATMIFVQATTSSFSLRKMQAISMLDQYVLKTRDEKMYNDDAMSMDGFKVTRKVTLPDSGNIVWIKFSIFEENGKKLHELNRLFMLK